LIESGVVYCPSGLWENVFHISANGGHIGLDHALKIFKIRKSCPMVAILGDE
jgi:hypothetical protein